MVAPEIECGVHVPGGFFDTHLPNFELEGNHRV
jgi:hypothetical protein